MKNLKSQKLIEAQEKYEMSIEQSTLAAIESEYFKSITA